jgi:hypothetical protein
MGAEVKNVVSNYSSHNIPLDTMCTLPLAVIIHRLAIAHIHRRRRLHFFAGIDIDYMDQYRDYTWDPVRFPVAVCSLFSSYFMVFRQNILLNLKFKFLYIIGNKSFC